MLRRSAIRLFAQSPWFVVAATLIIAVGIGTNAAIFSLVNRVLLRDLPYADPDRLVWISTWNNERGQYSKSSAFDYGAWVRESQIFEAVEAYWDRGYTLSGTAEPESLIAWQFTPGLISMLGAQPALGRTFRKDDALPGNDAVVILSDALWRRRFGARPD